MQNHESYFRELWTEIGQTVATENNLEDDKIRMAKEEMKRPFQEGHNPTEFMQIPFNNVLHCVAYTLRVSPCHSVVAASAAEEFFRRLPADASNLLLARPHINIVSVGGGPGSDLMGFCRVLNQEWEKRIRNGCSGSGIAPPEAVLNVEATIVDYFSGWEEIVDELRQVEFEQFNLDISFKRMDLARNLADPDKLILQEADVILVVKVLSSALPSTGKFILMNVGKQMKHGSILVFVDKDTSPLQRFTGGILQAIVGPTEGETVSTCYPWQNFMVNSYYKLLAVQCKCKTSKSEMVQKAKNFRKRSKPYCK